MLVLIEVINMPARSKIHFNHFQPKNLRKSWRYTKIHGRLKIFVPDVGSEIGHPRRTVSPPSKCQQAVLEIARAGQVNNWN